MGQRKKEGAERRKYVLDAAAFLNSSFLFEGELYTTPSVVSELKSEKRFMMPENIHVLPPKQRYKKVIVEKAQWTGDLPRLSDTDLDVLALALQVRGTLITDDFHVQNVAAWVGIPFEGITVRIRKRVVWRKKCPVCGKEYSVERKKCPKCGVPLILLRKTRCY